MGHEGWTQRIYEGMAVIYDVDQKTYEVIGWNADASIIRIRPYEPRNANSFNVPATRLRPAYG